MMQDIQLILSFFTFLLRGLYFVCFFFFTHLQRGVCFIIEIVFVMEYITTVRSSFTLFNLHLWTKFGGEMIFIACTRIFIFCCICSLHFSAPVFLVVVSPLSVFILFYISVMHFFMWIILWAGLFLFLFKMIKMSSRQH